MKNMIFLVGSLLIAIVAAFIVHHWLSTYNDPGYVLIGAGHWSLETSLVFFGVALVVTFFIFYLFFRLLGWLLRLPGKMKNRGQAVKFNRSQEALIAGLVDSAEGNWEKAEKILIKHASHSGAPLIHYLTAARAAQSRGAVEKRDEYLRIAAEKSSGSDIAVGLTQAELHLSEQQFEQALETLAKLHAINPGHASVLKLLHQTYQSLGDWQGIRKLIPSLTKSKVLMETEVKLLEAEACSSLLKQAAERGEVDEIQLLWQECPEHIKTMQGIPAIYFAGMIEVGAGAKIEDELARAISEHWDETLLVLFGSVQSNDFQRQLHTAEGWLTVHPEHPVLLRILGKISIHCKEMDKAEQYLEKSIALEPSVSAYQLLGDVLFRKGDKNNAIECYKYGLELASGEVVNQVESFSG
ncbi:MAG: heme biosynthesis protein HemY [Gammaproteobacteria bacterium HGW-Gammaproteobacteria-3]|nr:MAG: heme biosynthesis protein HemY [Gammaproteobacteria bacterium HGW-Gammaproteobacteria-3]